MAMTEAERVKKNGIGGVSDAMALLRGILKRQDGQNAPGDGDELYVFCEAFKVLYPGAASGDIHPTPGVHAPVEIVFTDGEVYTDPILAFFKYAHLPPHLQPFSRKFTEMARWIMDTFPRNAERTVALRKLLEAKDAAVRAGL
jgi:hypothetical protein